MQHTTQAEFEVWYEENIGDENKPVREAAFSAWEASPRSQATPISQWVVDDVYSALAFAEEDSPKLALGALRKLYERIAAVQQPETAPVKLPEPVVKIEDGKLKWHIPDSRYSLPVRYLQGTHNLYTEQQVRDILAQHGINNLP